MTTTTQPHIESDFPLPRPLCRICLGNGLQGLLIWGDAELHVAIARSGFYDHRGANTAIDRCNFQQLRAWLEAGDMGVTAI